MADQSNDPLREFTASSLSGAGRPKLSRKQAAAKSIQKHNETMHKKLFIGTVTEDGITLHRFKAAYATGSYNLATSYRSELISML